MIHRIRKLKPALFAAVLLSSLLLCGCKPKVEPPPVFDSFEYDQSGRLLSHSKSRADGRLSFLLEYGYDEEGRLCSYSRSDGAGLVAREEYSYDQSGRLSEKRFYDESGELEFYRLYEYSGENLQSKIDYTPDGKVLLYTRLSAGGKAVYGEKTEYNAR